MALRDIFKKRTLKKLIENNDMKEIVVLLKELEYDSDEYHDYEDIIIDNYNINIQDFFKIINEEGTLNYDYIYFNRFIVFNNKLKRVMISTNPNWEEHFPDIINNYIKETIDNPKIDELIETVPHDPAEKYIEKYYKNNNLTQEYYDEVFCSGSFYYHRSTLLKNPIFNKNITELERKLISSNNKSIEIFSEFLYKKRYKYKEIIKRNDLSKYFDGKNLTKTFFKEALFHPVSCVEIYENIGKYKQYYSELELAILKLFYDARAYGDDVNVNGLININNYTDYFYLDNSKLKLTKKGFKTYFEQKEWELFGFLSLSEEELKSNFENQNEYKIYSFYQKIDSYKYKEILMKIIEEKKEIFDLNENDLNKFLDLFKIMAEKLKNSNSSEMLHFKGDILLQLLNSKNPERDLELINDIYQRNNLPNVGKAYLVFKLLNPSYENFDFSEKNNYSSPILLNTKDDNKKDIMIFSDLIKAAMGSNNRSIKMYLRNIKEGNELFLKLKEGKITFNNINKEEKSILKIFVSHLNTLYNNTKEGQNNPRKLKGDIIEDLKELEPLFKVTSRYDLPDRIVRMFAYFAGFKSYSEMANYFNMKTKYANEKNKKEADNIIKNGFKLEEGDFVKGLGQYAMKYLETILQNGSVAKEFLCIGASSDATPLDTDLSRITKKGVNLESTIDNTPSRGYGPIWFKIKNSNRLSITRDENGETNNYDKSKIEVFKTKKDGHYGIRSGFASSEIDAIIVSHDSIREILPEIKYKIALNGFYIPVVDSKTEKLVFTPEEYDKMSKKIQGLDYYTDEEIQFSDNLNSIENINSIMESIDNNVKDANNKKQKINEIISTKLKGIGINVIEGFDYDMSMGNAQLIDTGSTGRATSTGKSSDFDYILRIDSNANTRLIKESIEKAFNCTSETSNNIRLKGVKIEGIEEEIDIDISFIKKSESNFYSTDRALKDRLENIKKQDSKKYKEVLANIIFAKQFLKKCKSYKPEHSRDEKEGGLGGVGVENWILQNGGSFIDAATSFYNAAKGKSFEKFKEEYKIWDAGLNYYTGRYDEFVSGNMTKDGYNKMVKALGEFLKEYREKNNVDNHSFKNGRIINDYGKENIITESKTK